jgi:hypothetical protein
MKIDVPRPNRLRQQLVDEGTRESVAFPEGADQPIRTLEGPTVPGRIAAAP